MMQCPNCEIEIRLHLNTVSGQQVKEERGDLGICFECGQPMIFDGKEMLGLEPEDMEMFPPMQRLMLHWQYVKWNGKYSIRGS
jgi:hypothetical protein